MVEKNKLIKELKRTDAQLRRMALCGDFAAKTGSPLLAGKTNCRYIKNK